MARRCEICQSGRLGEIDPLLQQNVAHSKIASDFGFTARQVGSHFHNHVQPFIQTAVELATQAIVSNQLQFRKETHYSTIDKVKLMQDKLLNELDVATEPEKIVAIVKEFRGWSIEEAKLTGAYTKEQENPKDIERVLQSFGLWLEKNPTATIHQKADAIRDFAQFGKVDEKELGRLAGVDVQEVDTTA